MKYTGFDFGDGTNKLSARLAGYDGTMEFRLDASDGDVIVSFVPNTDDWTAHDTFGIDLNNTVSGTHDLYIAFKDSVNVNRFKFE